MESVWGLKAARVCSAVGFTKINLKSREKSLSGYEITGICLKAAPQRSVPADLSETNKQQWPYLVWIPLCSGTSLSEHLAVVPLSVVFNRNCLALDMNGFAALVTADNGALGTCVRGCVGNATIIAFFSGFLLSRATFERLWLTDEIECQSPRKSSRRSQIIHSIKRLTAKK